MTRGTDRWTSCVATVWVQMFNQELDRRFSSMDVPFTRVPFWVPIFNPLPFGLVFFWEGTPVLN